MGTSKSYSGPSGKNPLIPDWAEDGASILPQASSTQDTTNPNEGSAEANTDQTNMPTTNNPAALESWGDVKGNFTRYAGNSSSSASGRSTLRSFVRAHGGAKSASSSSRRGRRVVQNIGGVLSGLAQQGTKFVYEGFNFQECVGKTSTELLATLVELVAPDSDDLESMIARNASIEAFQKLFEIFDINAQGLDSLKNLNVDNIKIIFQTYLSEYIFASLLQKAGQKLGKISHKDAIRIEKRMKGYISSKVNLDLSNIDLSKMDWKGQSGKAFVQSIFEKAYELMET
ncbi:MAG TPA: hypothetical protein PKD18_24300 [Saprospiraceae bacterium]|jgi:hypothetical protein|nr:hypothetical protein [Saprospiraceae bacterium]